jgi:hypothetical protein
MISWPFLKHAARDGLDCIDAASDKELRRSRVEIIESTATLKKQAQLRLEFAAH